MNSRKTKKKTIELINVMIRHADKGPSGFWTDDYEGCEILICGNAGGSPYPF